MDPRQLSFPVLNSRLSVYCDGYRSAKDPRPLLTSDLLALYVFIVLLRPISGYVSIAIPRYVKNQDVGRIPSVPLLSYEDLGKSESPLFWSMPLISWL